MKKSGGPPQTRVDVKLPSTQWIPGRVAIEYLQRRLGYLPASVAELLRSALLDGHVKIRFDKDNPAMPYGLDHQTIEGATVRDLYFKRESLRVWADKLMHRKNEQDIGKVKAVGKSAEDGDNLNPKIKTSMEKMILGMAKARYGYDPNADRNKAIAEIMADLDRLGLGLSEDTIRKRLREAADSLPRTDVAES